MDHTAFYTANYTMLPSPRKHSPEGVTALASGSSHLITAYYSFIDPERMKVWAGLVIGWPIQRTVYPYKWLPISCRSSAGQWKFAGQRPKFYHWATQQTKLSINQYRKDFRHNYTVNSLLDSKTTKAIKLSTYSNASQIHFCGINNSVTPHVQ